MVPNRELAVIATSITVVRLVTMTKKSAASSFRACGACTKPFYPATPNFVRIRMPTSSRSGGRYYSAYQKCWSNLPAAGHDPRLVRTVVALLSNATDTGLAPSTVTSALGQCRSGNPGAHR